jgi:hypothetical protein
MKKVVSICLTILVIVVFIHIYRKRREHYEELEDPRWNVPAPVVEICDQPNLNGKTEIFSSSVHDLKLHNFDNAVNSLLLGPYTQITLYKDPYYRGDKKTFVNTSMIKLGVQDVGEKLRNNVSSFKLRFINPWVIGFEYPNQGGSYRVITESQPNLGEFSNRISSLKCGPYTQVYLYDKPGYKGKVKLYENTEKRPMEIIFIGSDWNKNVKSLKLHSMLNVDRR